MAYLTLGRLYSILVGVFLVLGLRSDDLIRHRTTASGGGLLNWGKRSYKLFEDPLADRLNRGTFHSGWVDLADLVPATTLGAGVAGDLWSASDWTDLTSTRLDSRVGKITEGSSGVFGGVAAAHWGAGAYGYFASTPIYPLLSLAGGSGGSQSGYPVSSLAGGGGGGGGGGGFNSPDEDEHRRTSATGYDDDLTKEVANQLSGGSTRTPDPGPSMALVASVLLALASATRRCFR